MNEIRPWSTGRHIPVRLSIMEIQKKHILKLGSWKSANHRADELNLSLEEWEDFGPGG